MSPPYSLTNLSDYMKRQELSVLSTLLFCCSLISINARAGTPFIDSILPPSAVTGPIAITIHGANFEPGAQIDFGGLKLNPDSVLPDRIGVTIPAASLMNGFTANITVVNPSGAGPNRISNIVNFPVGGPSLDTPVTAEKLYPMPEPVSVSTGDFYGDGNLDLAVANRCVTYGCTLGTIDILLGDGAGNFTPGYSSPVSQPERVALGDFNGDGNLDAVVVSTDNTITILLGDGTGTFGASSFLVDQASSSEVAIGDFNGDGKLDLVVAGYNADPLVLLGDGTGHFTPGTSRTVAGGVTSMVAGDFNGDGKLDLAVGYSGSSNLHILFGDGAGNFTTSVAIAFSDGADGIAAADFNGDGNLDLAVTYNPGHPLDSLAVLLGDGTGRFQMAAPSPVGFSSSVTSVTAADMNADGKLDLVVASGGDGVTILLGDGTGKFRAVQFLGSGEGGGPVALGEFNGDGRLDIVLGEEDHGNLSVRLQIPSPQLQIQYSVTDLCAPVSCMATILGNSGVVAGLNFAVYPGSGYVDFIQRTGEAFSPFWINNAGVIVGAAGPAGAAAGTPFFAAVWVPQTSQLLNLDPVVGWTQGVATFVNNHNEIVGYSTGIRVNGLVPGYSLVSVSVITDNEIILGGDSGGSIAYAPGVGTAYLPGAVIEPWTVNSAGQILLSFPYPGQYFTTGSGITTQPAVGGFTVVSFNTVGQYLGYGGPHAPALYTASGGLVYLNSLLVPGSGWVLISLTKINDNGQILAYAVNNGRSTSVLLTPTLVTGAQFCPGCALSPNTTERATDIDPRAERFRGVCPNLTFNSRKACAGVPERTR